MSENKKINLVLSGQVQGVGLRLDVKQEADDMNLVGWVRNFDDGTMHIEAEGAEDRLKDFIKWCYNGSKSGRVDQIDESWSTADGQYDQFTISYSMGR